jgi:transcriptional regulator
VVFYVVHGRLPQTSRHTCDNPPCNRPSHIIDGTQVDNIADMDSRGRRGVRNQHGILNAQAVLTEDMVRAARKLYRGGTSMETIAMSLDRDVSAIRFAIIGDTWSHITDVPPVTADERRSPGGKLTRTQIEQARARRAAGESCANIARDFGCTPSNISYLTRDNTKPKKPRVRVHLTDEQVRQIRLLRVQEVPYQSIADRFGISRGLVNHIVNGRAYTHVK